MSCHVQLQARTRWWLLIWNNRINRQHSIVYQGMICFLIIMYRSSCNYSAVKHLPSCNPPLLSSGRVVTWSSTLIVSWNLRGPLRTGKIINTVSFLIDSKSFTDIINLLWALCAWNLKSCNINIISVWVQPAAIWNSSECYPLNLFAV